MTALAADDDTVKLLGTSPNGAVDIKSRLVNESFGTQYIDFIDSKTEKTIFSFRSSRRSTGLIWETPGDLLCLNDQTATSGDAIYIFRIGSGTRITLLRYPSDDFAFDLAEILRKQPEPGRFTFFGLKWLPNHQLLTEVTAGHYGSSNFEATLQVDKDGCVQLIKPKPQIPGLVSPSNSGNP